MTGKSDDKIALDVYKPNPGHVKTDSIKNVVVKAYAKVVYFF